MGSTQSGSKDQLIIHDEYPERFEEISRKLEEPMSDDARNRALIMDIYERAGGKLPFATIFQKTLEGLRAIKESIPLRKTHKALTTLQFLNKSMPEKTPLIPGLLYARDQICFTGRRRNGKTQFLMNLALAGAEGEEFLGISIPKPFKTLLCLLEDDSGELQDKVRVMPKVKSNDNVRWLTRDTFLEAKIKIDVTV